MGFSNFGHFKAQIKRPSCNPIIKDERFKKLNTINEGIHDNEERFGGMFSCDSQAINYPFQEINSQYYEDNLNNAPFGFSKVSSPVSLNEMNNLS